MFQDQPQQQPNAPQDQQSLSQRCSTLERAKERQRAAIDELKASVARLEELIGKNQHDFAYAQQQLEFVVMSLERQHGIVADHTEQLRLFAGESSTRVRSSTESAGSRPLMLLIGNWIYTPVVHFAKGVYTLFSPIINTAQSLSLLNSEVLNRNVTDRIRWAAVKKGELLGMLQKGFLDPDASPNRK